MRCKDVDATADIDDPLPPSGSSSGVKEPSADSISMLADMGFTQAQARKALIETVRLIIHSPLIIRLHCLAGR